MREIKTIGIIGEGKMGTNLFYYLLDFGFSIIWVCSEEADIEKIIKSFNKKLKRSLDTGIMDETSCSKVKVNTIITNDLLQLHQCDLIIEAVSEDLTIKKRLFKDLDRIVNKDCIFASNSSSFIPSELLASEYRKDKLVGLHFFYPVSLSCSFVSFLILEAELHLNNLSEFRGPPQTHREDYHTKVEIMVIKVPEIVENWWKFDEKR